MWFFAAHGWLYYFGDAEAHLNIARRLVDTPTPGWEQLGVPWLPLPHLLIAPFAGSKMLWHSGLAGSIPSAICFAFAAFFLFCAVEETFASVWPAWTAMLVFLLNPNALYLQSTAMTEPVFAFTLCGLLYFSVRHTRTQHIADAAFAGLFATAGTLTRYEGWLLLPFCAIYLFATSKRRWITAATFSAIAAIGPSAWLYYNWWLTGSGLDFYNGPGSAIDIQGAASYPGLHDWRAAWLYVRTATRLVLGAPLYWLMAIGLVAAIARKAWQPAVLLALPPLFYVWSMHGSGTPIHVPELYPHSWYNTRYGLAALPLAAFCAGAITLTRFRWFVVVACVLPWLWHPTQENWITWKESEQNSISRRAWTYQASDYLRGKVHGGEHVAAEFNDTMGIFRYAGIDMKQVFHPGNGLGWDAAVQRPDLFLKTTWIVCQHDKYSRLCPAAEKADYALIKSIEVPDAPPVYVYRHVYPVQ